MIFSYFQESSKKVKDLASQQEKGRIVLPTRGTESVKGANQVSVVRSEISAAK